ncbi:hypothetical protein [Pseudomonas sp. FP2294]|uniref:hypothetical protein n=1 Tax=Pseudomonas sp. FP2294 TaxID=2954089 RepID=UPI0027324620|nr:hypothetical protein [Pseudomonas sp. FP2294]WLH55579.1 hypothetical protein PSH73_16800 [Pseudomonas sp. FP2294]
MDCIILVLYITCPPIALAIMATVTISRIKKNNDSWPKTIWLDPDHGLSKQALFWIVVLTPIIYFTLFGWSVWKTQTPSLSIEGFNKFIEISKLPIALLSLSIPLAALVTKLHSTAQTARQIEKNKHELFYLHRREFVSYYELVGNTKFPGGLKVDYRINPRIHNRLFAGEPADGTPRLKIKVIDEQIASIINAREELKIAIEHAPSDESRNSYAFFCQKIFSLISFFSIKDIEHIIYDKNTKLVPGVGNVRFIPTVLKAIDGYLCVENYMISTLEFVGYQKGIEKLMRDRVNFKDLLSKSNNGKAINNYAKHI